MTRGREEDGAEGRDKKRRKGEGGAVEKERKVENALFFSLSLVHMRAQLYVALSHFQICFQWK